MGGSAARSADARQAQLRALEAQFYQQFEWPEEKAVHPKQSGDMEEEVDEEEVEDKDEEDEEEEKDEEDEDEDEDEDYTEDDADGDNHPEWDDATDLLQSAQGPALPLKSHGRQPETVVFTDPSASRASAPMSKQARKQFMVRFSTHKVFTYRAHCAGRTRCSARTERRRLGRGPAC